MVSQRPVLASRLPQRGPRPGIVPTVIAARSSAQTNRPHPLHFAQSPRASPVAKHRGLLPTRTHLVAAAACLRETGWFHAIAVVSTRARGRLLSAAARRRWRYHWRLTIRRALHAWHGTR